MLLTAFSQVLRAGRHLTAQTVVTVVMFQMGVKLVFENLWVASHAYGFPRDAPLVVQPVQALDHTPAQDFVIQSLSPPFQNLHGP